KISRAFLNFSLSSHHLVKFKRSERILLYFSSFRDNCRTTPHICQIFYEQRREPTVQKKSKSNKHETDETIAILLTEITRRHEHPVVETSTKRGNISFEGLFIFDVAFN
ncbi:hypothetical protein V1477_017049, partial [Vespula maculifrons]